MKANELPINTFLQAANVQFVIPVYQRNYDWDRTQCSDLLNDIISVEEENRGTHFIGSIVFIHEGTYSTSEVKELVIIDGQQRLTTINILYVALYRYAKENLKTNDAERLFNMFLVNQYVHNEDSKLKLKQTDNNSRAFKAILNGTEKEFGIYSNVIENFTFFLHSISEELFNVILNGLKRLIFVEISLERDKDDPQRIFESLNSTGLDLSQSDLIRNFILMDLEPRQQNLIFEQVWNPIEENARDLVKQKSLVSDFIRDYLTLKNKKIPNKNNVYLEFKKLNNNKKEDIYKQELENIKSLSVHYKKLINPYTVRDTNIRRELEYISRLEINVAYPFLLQVFEDYENGIIDQQTIINILQLIQSYTWRRFIVNLPTAALNKVFMTLYSEIDIEDYYNSLELALMRKKASTKFPTNDDIFSFLKEKDMYNTQSKNRNYFFELLENYKNREYVDTTNSKITIEHIFPQTPNEDWNKTLSNEDFSNFKEKKINTIANLTLSGNNGALSNKSFLDKQNMNKDGGEQGYKFSRLWLNSYLNQIEEWNLENYDKRFAIIYERFINIWKYPSIEIPEEEFTQEQNIFDADSPKNQNLEYFIFENTKIEEEIIAQMYYYVIKKLYDKNPELLISNNVNFKISRNSSDFRAPQDLINGYYIEANIDSESKFSYLKRLLTLFNLEEELLIKYNDNTTGTPSRFLIRKKFWQKLLPQMNEVTNVFDQISPSKQTSISASAGVSGISYYCTATKRGADIDILISTSDKQKNKRFFSQLYAKRDEIEKAFGRSIDWKELPEYKLSAIGISLHNLTIFEENDWDTMCSFMCENMPKMISTFDKYIKELA